MKLPGMQSPPQADYQVVYTFTRLQAGDPSTGSGQGFIETKKMLLLK